jgi:hypothetical protein
VTAMITAAAFDHDRVVGVRMKAPAFARTAA